MAVNEEKIVIERMISYVAMDPTNKPNHCSLLCAAVHCSLIVHGCRPLSEIKDGNWPFPKRCDHVFRSYKYMQLEFQFVVLHDTFGYLILIECDGEYVLISCTKDMLPYFDDLDLDITKIDEIKSVINTTVLMKLLSDKSLTIRNKKIRSLTAIDPHLLPDQNIGADYNLVEWAERFYASLPADIRNPSNWHARSMLVSLLCFLYRSQYYCDFSETERLEWRADDLYNGELVSFSVNNVKHSFSVVEHSEFCYVVFRNSEGSLLSEYKISNCYIPKFLDTDTEKYKNNLRVQAVSVYVNDHALTLKKPLKRRCTSSTSSSVCAPVEVKNVKMCAVQAWLNHTVTGVIDPNDQAANTSSSICPSLEKHNFNLCN